MIRRGNKSFYILALVLISLLLSSCTPGCTEPYEFDSEAGIIESNPINSGVYGSYNNVTGGQIANSTSTGLRSNGQPIILKILGSWSSWEQIGSAEELKKAAKCTPCFKNSASNNCLCRENEKPLAEKFRMDDGKPVTGVTDTKEGSIDNSCATGKSSDGNYYQDDPNLCTCTTLHGAASDLDNYFVTTNVNYKNETPKPADEQEPCKFTNGLGLYLGMYGRNGTTIPYRMYHLYSTEEVCDVDKTKNPTTGKVECIDDYGNDVTQYIYRSANNKIFVKDDKSGNNGSDRNPNDDDFHEAGEVIRMIIYDQYYSDNYGNYKVTFLGGVIKEGGGGIFEYLVGIVEDFLLGKVSNNSFQSSDAPKADTVKRQGGIMEYMYTKLVQDSIFITIIQVSLLLYVTFFGFGILSGTVEISPKEMSVRIVKIALVMLFTTSISWYWYDQIVVGFFKDGMDGIISMFSGLINSSVETTSLISVTQIDKDVVNSNATRFSYIDYVIRKLMSTPVHRKIWGLVFGSMFGLLYVPMIYALILFFLYTVLMAAIVYITSLIKLVLALALGPMFVLASLFTKTESFFKQWLSFLAARSLEMIVLFLVLYSFLIAIDKGFMDLLWIRVCNDTLKLGLFTMNTVKLDENTKRTFVDWMTSILSLGALIFLLKEVVEKIPGMVTGMVSVSGVGSAATNTNAIAKAFAGHIKNAAQKAATTGASGVLRGAINVGKFAASATGAAGAWRNLKDRIPFRNPVSIARDVKIDSAIRRATNEIKSDAKNKGLTGAALDKAIRAKTISNLASEGIRDKTQFAVLGIDSDAISRRLNKKLTEDPLKKFIQDKAKELRSGGLYGKEMSDRLKDESNKWARENLNAGSEGIQKYLGNMGNLLSRESQLSARDAARRFAGDSEAQNKYLEYLNRNVAQRNQAKQESKRRGLGIGNALSRATETARSNTIGRLKSTLGMRDNYSASMAKDKFLKNLEKEERKQNYKKNESKNLENANVGTRIGSGMGINMGKDKLSQRVRAFDTKAKNETKERGQNARNALRREEGKELKDRVADEISRINNEYKSDLERYGYKANDKGETVSFSEGMPSKAQLQKEAADKLDALANRMTVVEGNGKGMDRALATVDELKNGIRKEFGKKIDKNKAELEAEKAALKKMEDRHEAGKKIKQDRIDLLNKQSQKMKEEALTNERKQQQEIAKNESALKAQAEALKKFNEQEKATKDLEELERLREAKKVEEEKIANLKKENEELKAKLADDQKENAKKAAESDALKKSRANDLAKFDKEHEKLVDAEKDKIKQFERNDKVLQKEMKNSLDNAVRDQQKLDLAATKGEKETMMQFLDQAKQEIKNGKVEKNSDEVVKGLAELNVSKDEGKVEVSKANEVEKAPQKDDDKNEGGKGGDSGPDGGNVPDAGGQERTHESSSSSQLSPESGAQEKAPESGDQSAPEVSKSEKASADNQESLPEENSSRGIERGGSGQIKSSSNAELNDIALEFDDLSQAPKNEKSNETPTQAGGELMDILDSLPNSTQELAGQEAAPQATSQELIVDDLPSKIDAEDEPGRRSVRGQGGDEIGGSKHTLERAQTTSTPQFESSGASQPDQSVEKSESSSTEAKGQESSGKKVVEKAISDAAEKSAAQDLEKQKEQEKLSEQDQAKQKEEQEKGEQSKSQAAAKQSAVDKITAAQNQLNEISNKIAKLKAEGGSEDQISKLQSEKDAAAGAVASAKDELSKI